VATSHLSLDPNIGTHKQHTMLGHATGALGEGKLRGRCLDTIVEAHVASLDGIHVDMNHLKKGEVK